MGCADRGLVLPSPRTWSPLSMSVNRFWPVRVVLTLSLGLLGGSISSRPTLGDEATEKAAQVVDAAHMIDPALASILESNLTSQATTAKIPVLIETVESLNGQT